MRIEACYDSHVHWAATGEFSQRLTLSNLKNAEEILHLRAESHHFRGEWLLGFGWDDTLWPEGSIAHRRILDKWMPDHPVALSRCDGHAYWLNTVALERSGLLLDSDRELKGGRVERDSSGQATGVVIDEAMRPVQALLPQPTSFEIRRDLLKGVQIFNEAGFSHIRDMTCDELQWNEAVRLDQAGLLTLAVEEYFWLKDISSLPAVLSLVDRARASQTPNLRVKGLKVFLDGALGSEGAWLSRCYHGRSHKGLILWEDQALEEVLRRAWKISCGVAVHAIGDAAVDRIVRLARKLKKEGVSGPLHLEHAELVTSETLDLMKELPVTCHLQPAHWLSDRRWLEEKVGDLAQCAFPWRRLQEVGVSFDFGSDSPIEPASVARTLQALHESSEAGVPRLLGLPTTYMVHTDLSWAPNSFTTFDEETHRPTQLVFRGQHIL